MALTIPGLSCSGMVINPSLNRHSEPLICSPTDALNMFLEYGLHLIMEVMLVFKDGAVGHGKF